MVCRGVLTNRQATKEMSLPRVFYSVEQMAQILHRSTWTIYRDTSRRNRRANVDLPPFIKIGNRILFPVKGFEEWISQKEQQDPGPPLAG